MQITPEGPPVLRGKQLELHHRDERVLSLARQIFIEEGYQAVSIDAIAKQLGFSRGTLYQRFSCKEELILELAIRCHRQLTEVMEYAASIPGRPRERIVAIGEAIDRYAFLYADNLRTLAAINSEIIREKVLPEQLLRAQEAESGMFRVLMGIVREAVEVGDLVLPPKFTAGSLCLALAALISGWAQLHRRPDRALELKVENPIEDILRSAHLLMDGYGWQPFYREWDYDRVYERVGQALLAFPALSLPVEERMARGKEGAA
jgi:AcrR family transcriptional regulator